MNSKGQISLLSVTTIIFAMVGIIGITGAGGIIAETVEYNTGDFNQIAASKLKADAYENRTEKELNYSLNIATLDRLDGEKNWDKNSIPELSEAKSSFSQQTEDILKEENAVYGCSPPQIDGINVNWFDQGVSAEAEIADRNIICERDGTEAYVPVKKTLASTNPRNSYLILNDVSITTAETAKSEIESSSWEKGTGSYSSGCEESIAPGERDEVNEEAKSNAKNNAETHSIGENIDTEAERPEFVEIQASTDFEYSTEAVSQETTDCTRKVYPENCQPGDAGCDPVPKPGEEYEAEYEAEVDEVDVDVSVSDTEREILDKDEEYVSQRMEFVYSHSIS